MTTVPNDTRSDLIRAAMACFAAYGFDGASMRMIAKQADRPISLFSHYFGSKEGLYLDVFKWLLESHLFARSTALHMNAIAPPRDREEAISLLRELIHIFYDESSPSTWEMDPMYEGMSKLLLQEIRNPRPSLRPLFIEHFGPQSRVLSLCIKAIRPELDDVKIAFIGISILGQVIGHGLMYGMTHIMWDIPETVDSSFQNSELLVDLCLHGLTGLHHPGQSA